MPPKQPKAESRGSSIFEQREVCSSSLAPDVMRCTLTILTQNPILVSDDITSSLPAGFYRVIIGSVRVSDHLLTKLLTSVEALQGEVSYLRLQNSTIQQKLDALSPLGGPGKIFTLFPKLSKKIRLMI
jgi:hypothetical protein